MPKDSLVNIKIFKENPDFKLGKPKQKTNRSFSFGYEGDYEKVNIKITNLDSSKYSSRITQEKKSDSIIFWVKTEQKLDSVIFNVFNDKFSDTLKLNIRDRKNDSLVLKSEQNKTLKFNDDFVISANLPLEKIEKSKISILNQDSLNIDFETKLDLINNHYSFIFEKEEEQEYNINLLPGAITDFYENQNDTLIYKLKTRKYDDYGNLELNLINSKFPIIIQLVLSTGEIKYEKYEVDNSKINFEYIDPGKYYIRIIYDQDKNGKYTTGNYLRKIKPEKVIYYPEELDVRSGWDLIQEFILQ